MLQEKRQISDENLLWKVYHNLRHCRELGDKLIAIIQIKMKREKKGDKNETELENWPRFSKMY